jgi:hypothetical protein
MPISVPLTTDELLTTTRAVRRRLDFTRPVPRSLVEECLLCAIPGADILRWDPCTQKISRGRGGPRPAVAGVASPPTHARVSCVRTQVEDVQIHALAVCDLLETEQLPAHDRQRLPGCRGKDEISGQAGHRSRPWPARSTRGDARRTLAERGRTARTATVCPVAGG